MGEEQQKAWQPTFAMRVKRAGRIAWLILERLFDLAADAVLDYTGVIMREASLFAGVALALIGLLNFQNGKNCDGNAADYLTCTRPSTFYYYTWFEVAIIILGVFLVMIWYFKRQEGSAHRR